MWDDRRREGPRISSKSGGFLLLLLVRRISGLAGLGKAWYAGKAGGQGMLAKMWKLVGCGRHPIVLQIHDTHPHSLLAFPNRFDYSGYDD